MWVSGLRLGLCELLDRYDPGSSAGSASEAGQIELTVYFLEDVARRGAPFSGGATDRVLRALDAIAALLPELRPVALRLARRLGRDAEAVGTEASRAAPELPPAEIEGFDVYRVLSDL